MVRERAVPLSVRLAKEDIAFISALSVPDAATMSDKVRYLVSTARIAAEKTESFEGLVEQTEDSLTPLKQALDALEQETGETSALLTVLMSSLPRLMADFETVDVDKSNEDKTVLAELEARTARRFRDLCDSLMRLMVTKKSPCIEPEIMRTLVSGSVLELTEIIKLNSKSGGQNDKS